MNERDWDEQTALLKRHFDPVMAEPVPARMQLRRPKWIAYARAASLLAVGIAIGMGLQAMHAPPGPTGASLLAARAARAHAVYVSEVRHPVEVDASQQEHLVQWLSRRLGLQLKVPVLASQGFELLGGRLLPGPEGPVAQFMYQDAAGKRLTLYVTRRGRQESQTAFRFAEEGKVSVFYWIDRDFGYALSGELARPQLATLATLVYRDLEK